MNNIYCKKEMSLADQEKKVFSDYLDQQEIAMNIWDLFHEWVSLSNEKVEFFYLKVYQNEHVIGLGLFLKINSFDMRTSYSRLRKNVFFNTITKVLSSLGRKCIYLSLRNLITANICRPFFYSSPEVEDVVMDAILTYLKSEKGADMVSIIDTKDKGRYYENAGLREYLCPSEAWFDVKQYSDISEYLKKHRSLKRNIKRRKNKVKNEIFIGPVTENDKNQLKACLDCSIENTRVYNPSQKFFEDNMFNTDVFNSKDYVHIVVRVGENIAGFHTFKISGACMGGVLGGFNRKYSRNNYVYERIIVASLDYAIQHNLKRVHYSLIDNFTKLRLVDSREPCSLFFYSRNPINRFAFKRTFKFNDLYELYRLENQLNPKNKIKKSK